ncbi:MAG: ChaN family lipoprotein [Bacteroidia bacterium]
MKIKTAFVIPFFTLLFITSIAMAQDKPAYRMFNPEGKKLKYAKALKTARAADVVFFGELHNDAIAHWLELEVLMDLTEAKGKKNIITGGEMFERHQVENLEAYLAGELDEETFLDSTKVWPNYKSDYRPVIEFCKAQGIPYIGTNIPRQYARMVARQGPEALQDLPENEKALMTPLPFEIDYELPSN